MRILQKVATAFRLLARADFHALRARWRFHRRQRVLASASEPFIFFVGCDRLVCAPQLRDSAAAFTERPGDACERQVFHAWLRPGDTAVDAGANIGLFTSVAAACVGPQGKVVSLEPTPRLVEHLRMSAHRLGHPGVEVLPVALGGEPGRAKFAFAASADTTVSQSLATAEVPAGTADIREVEVITLTTVAGRLPAGASPALVKLDVEGVEVGALKGAPPGWLTADGPLWVVECHPQALARFGTTVGEVLRLFPASEFDRWMVGKYAGPDGADLPPERLNEAALPAASFHNLIAVPLGERSKARRQALQPILTAH